MYFLQSFSELHHPHSAAIMTVNSICQLDDCRETVQRAVEMNKEERVFVIQNEKDSFPHSKDDHETQK